MKTNQCIYWEIFRAETVLSLLNCWTKKNGMIVLKKKKKCVLKYIMVPK